MKSIPKQPGWYWWSEYNAEVFLYRKNKGKSKFLYVKPPMKTSVEIRVTKNIAGTFAVLPSGLRRPVIYE